MPGKSRKNDYYCDRGNRPRTTANERERERMKSIAQAFDILKTHLPWIPLDTKLSKADTLRLAAAYIEHLNGLLQDNNHEEINCNQDSAMGMQQWPWRKLGRPKLNDDTQNR